MMRVQPFSKLASQLLDLHRRRATASPSTAAGPEAAARSHKGPTSSHSGSTASSLSWDIRKGPPLQLLTPAGGSPEPVPETPPGKMPQVGAFSVLPVPTCDPLLRLLCACVGGGEGGPAQEHDAISAERSAVSLIAGCRAMIIYSFGYECKLRVPTPLYEPVL